MVSAPSATVSFPRRVVVSELGETPKEAIERFVRVEPQTAPSPESLGPDELLIAVRSASVGWVDLLMSSGQTLA